jgi:hypothetical protein
MLFRRQKIDDSPRGWRDSEDLDQVVPRPRLIRVAAREALCRYESEPKPETNQPDEGQPAVALCLKNRWCADQRIGAGIGWFSSRIRILPKSDGSSRVPESMWDCVY